MKKRERKKIYALRSAALSAALCAVLLSSCAVSYAGGYRLPDAGMTPDSPAVTAGDVAPTPLAYEPSEFVFTDGPETEDGKTSETAKTPETTTKAKDTTKAPATDKATEVTTFFSVEELDALDDLESYFAGFENAHDDDDSTVNEVVAVDPDATDTVLQTLFSPTEFYSVPLSFSKQQVVMDIADQFGISPVMIFGVMYAETHYNADNGISANGKYIGVMQIAKGHLTKLNARFGITDLQDFIQNVTAGAYYLSYYTSFSKRYNTKEFNNEGDLIDMALMCYHRGEGNALKLWRKGTLTDGYCTKVKNEMARIVKAGPVIPTEDNL